MKYARTLAAASFALLTACSGNTVKTTLGLDRGAPDEFRVVSRPPLSVPPQFNLMPPSATARPPGQQPVSHQAASMVFGNATAAPSLPASAKLSTSAESQFLKDAGADQADPHIRDEMAQQHYVTQEQQDNSSWWNFFSTNPPKQDPVVNASKESQRIDQDQAAGQPVTTGDTPMAKQGDTGILGRLLGY
ncbi:MAG: DUF3035 domain-containing protein [Pseudomonadota bacterium]|nr:DUF3035 domain-containing protein [Pseudomonadota bacterium]MDE3036857.1 DUF3035 domain-containing protein [Pseudomonadota bacterium]